VKLSYKACILFFLPVLLNLPGTAHLHATEGPEAKSSKQNAPIFIRVPEIIRTDRPFWVEVVVGTRQNPVENLFGIAFDLSFQNAAYIKVAEPSKESLLPGPLLGAEDQLIYLNPFLFDADLGLINVGIARRSPAPNVDGFGVVFRARFKADDSIQDSTLISFSLSSITAEDSIANVIELEPISSQSIARWPEDYQIELQQDNARIAVGDSIDFKLGFERQGGFDQLISLNILPPVPGFSTSIDKDELYYFEQTRLHFQTDSSVAAGEYLFDVVATADTFVRTKKIRVDVFNIPIFPLSKGNVIWSDSSFVVSIQAGLPERELKKLKSIDFKLRYSAPEYIQLQSPESFAVTAGPLLGDAPDLQFDSEKEAGTIQIHAEIKGANSFASGMGTLANIKFMSDFQIPDGLPLLFSIEDVRAFAPDGQRIFLKPQPLEMVAKEKIEFDLYVSPEEQVIQAGDAKEFKLWLRTNASFAEKATITASGLPDLTSVGLRPETLGRLDTMIVRAKTDTLDAAGDYKVIFSAHAAGLVRRDSVNITILPAPDFSLVLTPSSQKIFPGDSTSFDLMLHSAKHLIAPVNIRLSRGIQLGWANLKLSGTELDERNTLKINVNTDLNSPKGMFYFRVIGESGKSTRAVNGTLEMKAPPPRVRPNPFTPNSDGFNDTVLFDYEGIVEGTVTVIIFDINGRPAIELRPGVDRWDGIDKNGRPVQPGAYMYIVKQGGKVLEKGVLGLAR